MKSHKKLVSEAEKQLKEFDQALLGLKNSVHKTEEQWMRIGFISMLVISFGIGYTVVKKLHARSDDPPKIENHTHSEENPHKSIASVLVKSISSELGMLLLSNLVKNLIKNKH